MSGRTTIDAAIKVISILLLASIFGMLLFQIVARNLLLISKPWIDELARFMMVWLTMIGAWAAARQGLHFRIELLRDRLGPAVRFIAVPLSIAGLLAIVHGGWLIYPRIAGNTSAALGWSMGMVYLPIPVIAGLIAFDLLVSLITGTDPEVRGEVGVARPHRALRFRRAAREI